MRSLGEGFLLTRADMEYFRDHYLPDRSDWENPSASPLLAEDLSGLAPALVVTAGFDPLRDDGVNYAEALRRAGVAVEYRWYDDQVHGFMGMGIVSDSLAAGHRGVRVDGEADEALVAGRRQRDRNPVTGTPQQERCNGRRNGRRNRRRRSGSPHPADLYSWPMDRSQGVLALVGGGEWRDGCNFDAELLAASGSDQVLVLPTAAAYEHPERVVVQAGEWFASLGAQVEGLMVLARSDAEDAGAAAVMRAGPADLPGRQLAHAHPQRAEELEGVERAGRCLARRRRGGGSSGAAMALTDPMVDARGGGLTIGLGLLTGLAVVPHFGDVHEDEHGEKLHRSVHLAPAGTPVAGIPERTALIRDPGGRWSSAGAGEVAVFLDGARAESGLGALPDLTRWLAHRLSRPR